MIEIRWHGRGGQGAKTVSELLALALLEAGRYVQAFPEYGPERSGAPVQAYTRSASESIRLHCAVTEPDAVVVLDPTLVREVDVTDGLDPSGLLLINSSETNSLPSRVTAFAGKFITIDADRLARDVNSKYPNMVMAGALAAVMENPPLESMRKAAVKKLGAKLSDEMMEVNLKALAAGYHTIQHPTEAV